MPSSPQQGSAIRQLSTLGLLRIPLKKLQQDSATKTWQQTHGRGRQAHVACNHPIPPRYGTVQKRNFLARVPLFLPPLPARKSGVKISFPSLLGTYFDFIPPREAQLIPIGMIRNQGTKQELSIAATQWERLGFTTTWSAANSANFARKDSNDQDRCCGPPGYFTGFWPKYRFALTPAA